MITLLLILICAGFCTNQPVRDQAIVTAALLIAIGLVNLGVPDAADYAAMFTESR